MSGLVVLEDPAGEGGLAAVLADLIAANILKDSGRTKLIKGLRGTIEVVAADGPDRTVATLRFDGERLSISPGSIGSADVKVTASYEDIVALSAIPVCPYTRLPKPLARKTFELVASLVRGKVRIEGLVLYPRLAISLLALVSVSD